MKKLALYLVLLLGLGIYAACDGGGDDDNNPGESCNDLQQINDDHTNSSIAIAGKEYLYFKFKATATAEYKFAVSMSFDVDTYIFDYIDDCEDSYKTNSLGGSGASGTADEDIFVDLTISKIYVIMVHSKATSDGTFGLIISH